jgi:hypothetical protein
MISGANENELEIANARADVLLMCGSETLKVIDKYYKQQLEAYKNMRKEAINFVEHLDNVFIDDKKQELILNILNKVGGSDE